MGLQEFTEGGGHDGAAGVFLNAKNSRKKQLLSAVSKLTRQKKN
jgi:nanoRNase/pAp phosphatase (c-di-AMP/oligoRNAs hydrolase)